ncbi:DinB family protein [Aggregatilineales bacterium SYSU G02658]
MTPQFHHERYVTIIKLHSQTLITLGKMLTQEEASTWRDGGTGWTVLEVLGHLLEYDAIFQSRVRAMLEQSNPTFQAYDHEKLAAEHAYNAQPLHDVLAKLSVSRAEMVAFFESLSDEQLARTGVHPEYGAYTVMRSVAQVAAHDANHIEQITRIMLEKKTA